MFNQVAYHKLLPLTFRCFGENFRTRQTRQKGHSCIMPMCRNKNVYAYIECSFHLVIKSGALQTRDARSIWCGGSRIFFETVPYPQNHGKNENKKKKICDIAYMGGLSNNLMAVAGRRETGFFLPLWIWLPCENGYKAGTKDFFSDSQYGFRRELSPTSQLVETVHDFTSVLDCGMHIDVFF